MGALVACFENWQDWSLPMQHLAVGICTMIAVTGMVLVYGAQWKLSPKSVAWYTWIQEVPVAGNVNVTGPVDVRQAWQDQRTSAYDAGAGGRSALAHRRAGHTHHGQSSGRLP